MRLFINGHQIDLYKEAAITYTKQVNSLNDLSSRQSNYTQAFRVPTTEKNRLFFKGLGIVGSKSNIPYQKNDVRLFGENVCIIFKGRVEFKSTELGYTINTYDGNLDFFKVMDNLNFDDIPLPELDHTKDVATIKSNWLDEQAPYEYLIADYNGKTHFSNGNTTYINTDYLVPAVSVKFLWERLFEHFEFTFDGTIFQDEEFKNLYLTFPKGTVSGETGDRCFNLKFPSQTMIAFPLQRDPVNWLFSGMFDYETEIDQGTVVDNTYSSGYYSYKVPESGYYNLEVTGSFHPRAKKGVQGYFFMAFDMDEYPLDQVLGLMRKEWRIAGPGVMPADQNGVFQIDYKKSFSLYAGQTITFVYDKTKDVNSDDTTLDFDFTVSRINQTAIDQFQFFKGLTPKDFYKEILWRFGLTPYPSKDRNHLDFLTWQERINGVIEDWSDKFIKSNGESYVYNGYAKNNYYRFKYNEEGDEFNDGILRIQNENLNEKTDIITSKTYSVEKFPTPFNISGNLQNVPKLELWKKEVKEENGVAEIEYKSRDSRFTFLRKKTLNTPADIGSEQLGVYSNASKVVVAENANYSNQRVIDKRYGPLNSLFYRTLIIKATFDLTEAEYDNFDLKARIFVKQLGGEFIVNKITKPDLRRLRADAELIKINR